MHSNGLHTPVPVLTHMRRKTAQYIRIQTVRKSTLKIIFSGVSRKAPLSNVVRKLHARSFIELVRFESCQKSGELSVGRKKEVEPMHP